MLPVYICDFLCAFFMTSTVLSLLFWALRIGKYLSLLSRKNYIIIVILLMAALLVAYFILLFICALGALNWRMSQP